MGGASSGDIRRSTGAPRSQLPPALVVPVAWARTSKAGLPNPVRSRMSPITVASTVTLAPTEWRGPAVTVAAYDADDSSAAVITAPRAAHA